MFAGWTRRGRKDKEGEHLCAEISRLELKLAQCLDFDTLQDLVDVYSVCDSQRAVEFYEALKDIRYRRLSEKLQQLLTRTDVQSLLQQSHKSLRQLNLNPIPLPRSQFPPLNTPTKTEESLWARYSPASFDLADVSWSSSEAESMIDSEQCLSARTAEMLKGDLQRQQRELSQKRRERRGKRDGFRSEASSFSHCGFPEDSENHPQNGLPYEDRLSAIVESHVLKRISLIADITSKYESQIAELAASGNSGIIAKVIEQMKIAQESETTAAISELETQRKAEISHLRKAKCCRKVEYKE